MRLLNKYKEQKARSRALEEHLYAQVSRELQNGAIRDGLWTKALANSHGNEVKAKSLYISYRVQSLKDESEIARAEQESKKYPSEGIDSSNVSNKKEKSAIKMLSTKGYSVLVRDFGWLIIEPVEENQVGGRTKLESIDELYNYALDRYYS